MRTAVLVLLIMAVAYGASYALSKDDYMDRKVSLKYGMEIIETSDMLEIPVFKGTVRNGGDEVLSRVEVTVHFLDKHGYYVGEMTYYPVKYYKFFVGSIGVTLDPYQEIDFSYPCKDCSASWFENSDVEVSDIDFYNPEFSSERFTNVFKYLYDELSFLLVKYKQGVMNRMKTKKMLEEQE